MSERLGPDGLAVVAAAGGSIGETPRLGLAPTGLFER